MKSETEIKEDALFEYREMLLAKKKTEKLSDIEQHQLETLEQFAADYVERVTAGRP